MPCHGLVKRFQDFWKKQREDAERLVKAQRKHDSGVISIIYACKNPKCGKFFHVGLGECPFCGEKVKNP